MDFEIEQRTRAEYGERTEERSDSRNGLVGALLLEQNDEWQLQGRYLSLEGLGAACDNQNQRLSAVVTG